MYTVYVLISLKNNKRYVGCTSKTAGQRLSEHNHHSNKWTKQNGPFEIIYTEDAGNKRGALIREKFLKSGQGRKWLDEKFKNNISGSSVAG